jgi:hypothetical protein
MELRANRPFRFYTASVLVKLTGHKARNVKELLNHLKIISPSAIFHHTHHSFREHHLTHEAWMNDFAFWATNALNDHLLGEMLANIDIYEYVRIDDLRQALIDVIEKYLAFNKDIRDAPVREEFYFSEAISIVMPTDMEVWTLEEFYSCLRKISLRSLYYHFFQARLRLKKKTTDFSQWIRDAIGLTELADKMDRIDLYMNTMEEIREKIRWMVKEEILRARGKIE